MRKTIAIIVLVIMGVCVASYAIITIYANIMFSRASTPASPAQPPSVAKAAYVIDVQELYREIYTNKWSQTGTIYTVYGYWDLQNNKWVYSGRTMKLNSNSLGQIVISRR